MLVFLISILFLIICLVFVINSMLGQKGRRSSNKPTRYSQTRNFMDFDAGADSDKVGDPQYPSAGMDSVLKHEFLEDLDNTKT